MDIVLIPGFWLDGSSWDTVVPLIDAAGHHSHPITLPGLEPGVTDRSAITLRDHVDAVVAEIDRLNEAGATVALVGHSGGGAVAHAAVDARPDAVATAIYVDTFPLPAGLAINDQLPVADGQAPLPDWPFFDDDTLRDLDDSMRADFRRRAVPVPAHVTRDHQQLFDERRFDVPITMIMCESPSASVQEWMAEGEPVLAELNRISSIEWVDLATGHWPQFTKQRELGGIIVDSLRSVR